MENRKTVEFTLSNEDIKFPTLYEEDLDSNFRKENITKEILTSGLIELINNFKIFIEKLTDATKKDSNNFKSLCLEYKINIYDSIVMMKLNQELASVVLSKFNPNEIKLSKYEDYFDVKNEENQENISLMELFHKNIDKDYAIIQEKTSLMFKCIKEIYETREERGVPLLYYMLKYYNKFLVKTKDLLDKFISIENIINSDTKIFHKNMIVFFDFIFQLRNLEYGRKVLYSAYINDKNDIFNYEENSEEWKELKKVIFKVSSKNSDKIKEEYEKMNVNTNHSLAYLDKIDFESNMLFNASKLAGAAIKYKFNNDESLKVFEHKQNQILSDKILLEEALKLLKFKFVKKIMQRSYPKIAFREKIYMKKEYPEITLEYIKSLLVKLYGEEIILKNFGDTVQPLRPQKDEKIREKMALWEQKVPRENKKYFVSTRLLNSYKLNLNKKIQEKSYLSFLNFWGNNNDDSENIVNEKPKALLIHIHGGGFLESNTFMLESFLREVSNNLSIPIIGIDYGCAPAHQYPEGLDDCYQSYMWILNHCEKELGFKPEKIFISGDSAGGNLLLGLILLLIAMNEYDNKKIRLPDLILPLYPCCTLDNNNATVSACLAFDKVMLSLKDIGYMREAYRGYYNNELDPFINIVFADEKLLKYFPPSRFITASHDALRDDTIRFLSKLCKIKGINTKLYDLHNYQHGFMDVNNELLKKIPLNIFYNQIKEFINK